MKGSTAAAFPVVPAKSSVAGSGTHTPQRKMPTNCQASRAAQYSTGTIPASTSTAAKKMRVLAPRSESEAFISVQLRLPPYSGQDSARFLSWLAQGLARADYLQWLVRSLGVRPQGARLERVQASPRWAGNGFRNVHPILPGLRDRSVPMPTLTEFLCGGERRVPSRPLPSLSPLERWRRQPESGLRATWLGHSTVLIEIDGLRVLTD